MEKPGRQIHALSIRHLYGCVKLREARVWPEKAAACNAPDAVMILSAARRGLNPEKALAYMRQGVEMDLPLEEAPTALREGKFFQRLKERIREDVIRNRME